MKVTGMFWTHIQPGNDLRSCLLSLHVSGSASSLPADAFLPTTAPQSALILNSPHFLIYCICSQHQTCWKVFISIISMSLFLSLRLEIVFFSCPRGVTAVYFNMLLYSGNSDKQIFPRLWSPVGCSCTRLFCASKLRKRKRKDSDFRGSYLV